MFIITASYLYLEGEKSQAKSGRGCRLQVAGCGFCFCGLKWIEFFDRLCCGDILYRRVDSVRRITRVSETFEGLPEIYSR